MLELLNITMDLTQDNRRLTDNSVLCTEIEP